MTPALRSMVRETHLGPEDFILPLFVVPGSNVKKEISSMPGVFRCPWIRSSANAPTCMRWGFPR